MPCLLQDYPAALLFKQSQSFESLRFASGNNKWRISTQTSAADDSKKLVCGRSWKALEYSTSDSFTTTTKSLEKNSEDI